MLIIRGDFIPMICAVDSVDNYCKLTEKEVKTRY